MTTDIVPPPESAVPAAAADRIIPRSKPAEHPRLKDALKGPLQLGLLITLIFFVIGGGWAATAPIAGAVIATGVVSHDTDRRTIQHLEGGILREIRVRAGDTVAAGDVLAVIVDVSAETNASQNATRLRTLAATEARLQAERKNLPQVIIDHPALADRSNREVAETIAQQINEFDTRRENDESRKAVLTQQMAQLREQIVGTERQLESVRRRKELIQEEVAAVKELFEKGYERKPRLLELQRTEAELLGDEGSLVSQLARFREAIQETRLKIANVEIERTETINEQLSKTQAERSTLEQEIREALDRLARTTIVSPVSGTVLKTHFKTVGGVVRPGEPIVEVVPSDDDLVIDVKISPSDVDDIHAGQHGYVIFPGFPQRNIKRIDAELTRISPDVLMDEATHMPYYSGKVRVEREVLAAMAPEIQIQAGMPAEVFIRTVDRTVLEYLVQPLTMVIEHSMREQ